MKQNSARCKMQVSRFLVIALVGWFSGDGVQSYKLTDSPVNLTSNDTTVAQKVEKLVEKNLVNDAEDDSKFPMPKEEGNSTNGSDFADLARHLEFMMLKMAQMETIVQLQQAEIAALQAENEAIKVKIGLDVQHVAMAQKRSRDPHAASTVLKKILDKHHRQRETRNFHPDANKELVAEDHAEVPPGGSQEEALLQRQARSSEKGEAAEQSLDDSLASKWNPFQEIQNTINKAVDAVDGTGLTGDTLRDAFNKVKEKGQAVEFIQNTVIDTVEMATTILTNFAGFKFDSSCRTDTPNAWLAGEYLQIQFGKLYCEVTLVSKRIVLFDTKWPQRSIHFPIGLNHLPQQIRSVAGASTEAVDRVLKFIHDVLNTGDCNRGDTFHCIAKRLSRYVMQFEPPLDWLPQQVKSVAGASTEAVDRVLKFIHDVLNTGHCDRGNTFHCIAKRLSRYVMEFEPPLDWLPSPVGVLANSPLNSIKSLMAMGKDLMHCQHFESGAETMKCLGFKIIGLVPPLNFLNHLGEVIAETVEAFAKAATALVKKALKGGTSLIQRASVSDFPAIGKMPVRHQQGDLIVELHSQEPHPSLLEFSSALGQERGGHDSEGPGIKLKDGDFVHATNLITQFDGREANSGSCLAFAPRNKNGAHVGNHQEVTKDDWSSAKKEDFVQLEPWAVPCDNTWMKDNWNKWQGYSFYTGTTVIEKCLSVTFKIDIQPVVAFIAGLSIKFLPTLFDLVTTVCWPNHMPGGLDLSVLRSELKTGDHLLFSRTLRLAKRFGSHTDFVKNNLGQGYQTWRSPLGIAKGESKAAFAPMSLLDGNRSHVAGDAKESWYWKTETENLYLASVDYGDAMEANTTWEMHGADAARHLSAMQEAQAQGKENIIQLFDFKKPGMTNFEVQGLLNGNSLELGLQMGYGPFQSPKKRIPLADIGVQFAVILAAVPWISVETKKTAIAALRDFSTEDAGRVQGLPLRPGSVIAFHSKAHNRYLSLYGEKLYGSHHANADGIGDVWTDQRFTVVDGKGGWLAFHNAVHNRFVKSFGSGVSPHKNADDLPDGWWGEKWHVVDAGNGEIALHSHGKAFLGLRADGTYFYTQGGLDHLPHDSSLRFTVVEAAVKLPVGSTVALYNTHHKKFISMDNGHLRSSPVREAGDLPDEWTYERFTVIKKDGDSIALHNSRWNRFIKINGVSDHKNPDQLPAGWGMEAFQVRPAVDSEIMLWNGHNRFVQMRHGGDVSESHHPPGGILNTRGWAWERFRAVPVKPYLEPGTVVALHSAVHNRFLLMQNDGLMGRSSPRNVDDLPSHWNQERFRVVDAGNGQVGLWNLAHKRFASMKGCQRRMESHHERLGWEAFTVVPSESLFRGIIGLHSTHHNCFVRMSSSTADSSSPKAIQDFPPPNEWAWERFHIVLAGDGSSEPVGKKLAVSLS